MQPPPEKSSPYLPPPNFKIVPAVASQRVVAVEDLLFVNDLHRRATWHDAQNAIGVEQPDGVRRDLRQRRRGASTRFQRTLSSLAKPVVTIVSATPAATPTASLFVTRVMLSACSSQLLLTVRQHTAR